jgi:hypothetical protein
MRMGYLTLWPADGAMCSSIDLASSLRPLRGSQNLAVAASEVLGEGPSDYQGRRLQGQGVRSGRFRVLWRG